MRRNYIAKCADTVREQFDIEVPVKDMEQVVKKLNGTIVESSEYSFERLIIKSEDNNGFIIQVLANQSIASRNFAVAQGLGRLFLKMGYMSNREIWNNYSNSSVSEKFVDMQYDEDEFAMTFLMPKKDYVDFVFEKEKNGGIDTFEISRHFVVPNGVAVNRGKWLGALQW